MPIWRLFPRSARGRTTVGSASRTIFSINIWPLRPDVEPDAPGGHQARSEVRSTALRAAVRGLEAPDEVRGPLWVGFGGGLVDVWPTDGGRWVVVD